MNFYHLNSATHFKQAAHATSIQSLLKECGSYFPSGQICKTHASKKLYCCLRVSKIKTDKKIGLKNKLGPKAHGANKMYVP